MTIRLSDLDHISDCRTQKRPLPATNLVNAHTQKHTHKKEKRTHTTEANLFLIEVFDEKIIQKEMLFLPNSKTL